MIQDYDGAEVVDVQGERIGTVERSYVDDSRTARFVKVAIGAFFPKHRLIPLAAAHVTSGKLVVPYTMEMIVESPDASSASGTLEGELLEQAQAYWSRKSTDVETAGSTEEEGTVVPDEVVLLTPEPVADTPEPATDTAQRIVEEEVVVVKRRVVEEVLLVRTDQVVEHQTISDRVAVIQDGETAGPTS